MMPQTDRCKRPGRCGTRFSFVRIACIAALLSVVPPGAASAQGPADDRVAASFLLARGRMPAPAEAQAWAGSAGSPISELLARHRQAITGDERERQAVAAKAVVDAFGLGAGAEPAGRPASGPTYLDLMRGHLEWLGSHAGDYARVVNRAYQRVLRREAYPQEIEYWSKRPVQSFALLAACVDDWARRNQPGLTVTSGPAAVNLNSPYLATVRLSPALAAEARAAAGFERPRNAALGLHVVAPGAARVAAVGGIHFAAAGAASVEQE
jgi:hypothetical protein